MQDLRPCVLSFAGFDPSGGAGILADIKTFEAHRVTGLGVLTALTVQNDVEFSSVLWFQTKQILDHAEALMRRYPVAAAKIGLISSLYALMDIADHLKSSIPAVRIVWDPILRASAGYTIHEHVDPDGVRDACSRVFLVTPNVEEARILMNQQDEMKAAEELSQFCHVFLKGGHSAENKGTDYLFEKGGAVTAYPAAEISLFPKHGSGCVLSSAITANLALGLPLAEACEKAKTYIAAFLGSHESLVGYHSL